MPLRIILSELVLISHCMFPLYSDLSCVISIHHWCHFTCMIPMNLLWTLSRSLFQLFRFLHLFHVRSTYHWCYRVCAVPVHWLLTLNRSLFRLFVSALFAKQILIFFMSVAYMSPVPSPVHLWCVG